MRGEDANAPATHNAIFGSPPRAWGGRCGSGLARSCSRLTPTCVGRTRLRGPESHVEAAHPHVRGEDMPSVLSSPLAIGSPPRAWGGHLGERVVRSQQRLTPTCVGRTHPGAVGQSSPAAHPHVRGEDAVLANAEVAPLGSPPRAWGGPPRRDCLDAELRLTPTCVGRTSGPPSGPTTRTAHPHVRGEDCLRRMWREAVNGSPPRAWGGQ